MAVRKIDCIFWNVQSMKRNFNTVIKLDVDLKPCKVILLETQIYNRILTLWFGFSFIPQGGMLTNFVKGIVTIVPTLNSPNLYEGKQLNHKIFKEENFEWQEIDEKFQRSA